MPGMGDGRQAKLHGLGASCAVEWGGARMQGFDGPMPHLSNPLHAKLHTPPGGAMYKP